jgi:hypothetical protein
VAFLRSLRAGSVYVEEGNETHNFSLIYSGSMVVLKALASKDGVKRETIINDINPYEFIESPEWLARLFEEKMETFLKKAKPKEPKRGTLFSENFNFIKNKAHSFALSHMCQQEGAKLR